MMRAAYVAAPGKVEVGDFAIPEPAAGQVLVRMHLASICGTDLHTVFEGFLDPAMVGAPGYPGHEGVGEIIESRSPGFAPGQAVLTVPPGPMGGCFAQYQAVRGEFLVPLPAAGDPARLLLAQQLGTTLHAMRKFWPGGEGTMDGCEAGWGMTPDSRVATVIGAGSAGLFFIQHLRRLGFEKIVIADLEPGRLDVARELGADVVVHAPHESVVEATLDLTAGEGADLVIEAAGYDVCRQQAVEAVRPRGRVGCFGYPERRGLALFPVELAFRRSARIEFMVGTQFEPGLRSFREAVEMIHGQVIEVGYCLKPRFPLEDAAQAMATAYERGHGAAKVGLGVD